MIYRGNHLNCWRHEKYPESDRPCLRKTLDTSIEKKLDILKGYNTARLSRRKKRDKEKKSTSTKYLLLRMYLWIYWQQQKKIIVAVCMPPQTNVQSTTGNNDLP